MSTTATAGKTIVLLGMMTKMPFAGVVWLVAQYLVGFRRLGYDVYYVEDHGRAPKALMESETEDGSVKAAAYIDRVMRHFDLGDRWAYRALHDDGRCFGLSETQLMRLYRSAGLILNLHGGTAPRPEHSATGRLVFLETDPVKLQIDLHNNSQEAVDLLTPHVAFFTWGLNYGNRDCKLPTFSRFQFQPSPPPVVMDCWQGRGAREPRAFTTVGSWSQWRTLTFNGEMYYWSKHFEFQKFLDLPRRSDQEFELALSNIDDADRQQLRDRGWKVRDGLELSRNPDSYRDFIAGSRGEFTVAKDQNIRLRSGWFSERSATYLAAGRPVITQETGFSNLIPTGDGLFSFSTMEEIMAALHRVNADYQAQRRAATTVAREYFNYDVVLPRLLAAVGVI